MVAAIDQISNGISLIAGQAASVEQRVQQAGARCDQGSEEITATATVVETLAADVQETADSRARRGVSEGATPRTGRAAIDSRPPSLRGASGQNNRGWQRAAGRQPSSPEMLRQRRIEAHP
jgi:hypothetical protein